MTLPEDFRAIPDEWKRKGFSCDIFVDPPGRCWEDYIHTTDELVMVMEGQMEFEIEGTVHHPSPGKEIFIPRGKKHSVRNIGQVPARWLYGYNR